MLTLDEHNHNVKEMEEMIRRLNVAGVACPKCKAEMVYDGRTAISGHAQSVVCPKCNYRGMKRD